MPVADLNRFLLLIRELVHDGSALRITLSKPRKKEAWLKCHISSFLQDDVVQYKIVGSSKTQDFTEIASAIQLPNKVEKYLQEDFFFADVYCPKADFSLMQSAKGKLTLIEKKSTTNVKMDIGHNKQKNYLIDASTPFLSELGITNKEGKILADYQKKYRQINKFIEVFSNELGNAKMDQIGIADMGSGKAYLTFAMYHYLSQHIHLPFQITGYEMRKELVDHCNKMAKTLAFDHLEFQQGSIDSSILHPDTNIVIALHACDIATDMALAKAIESEAQLIIVSPCCHKQIRKAITKHDAMTRHGILLERQAEIITDTIRAMLLEQHGYKTKVFEFISAEHTGKNLMITAIKTDHKIDNQDEINVVKDRYGIEEHYLERLLK